jgi:hypothetical protein
MAPGSSVWFRCPRPRPVSEPSASLKSHGALLSIGPVDALVDERATAQRPLTRLTALAPGQRPEGV